MFILGKEPENEQEYCDLANALIAWAKKETSHNINDFPLSLLIPPNRFSEYAKQSDYFKRGLLIALQLIGARREQLAHEGRLNRQIVMATMPLYDLDYKQLVLNLRHNTEEESEPKTFNIYMGDPASGNVTLETSYTIPKR